MKVRCMIVDDEPLAIEVLKSHIKKISSLEVVECCRNVIDAFESLNKRKIDLLFLDIQMPIIKGTDFIRDLKSPPNIILTTAHQEYALEGYDLGVLDYLVKPISFERFCKAVNKLLYPSFQCGSITPNQSDNDHDSFIYLKSNKKFHKIILHDILFIESKRDYIIIHTHNRQIKAKSPITSIEEIFTDNEFLRIHRSFIVSIKNITSFTACTIEVLGTKLPIGRNYKQQVNKVLKYDAGTPILVQTIR
jgi:two-component system, LytTR family, response regulator